MTAMKATSYKGSYNGSAIEPKNPVMQLTNTIAKWKVFFILLLEQKFRFNVFLTFADLSINSPTKSLIFNGLL